MEAGDEDGVASSFLAIKALDGERTINPWGVAAAFGLGVRPCPPRKTEGYYHHPSRTIYVLFCSDVLLTDFLLTHELSHVALALWGLPSPHCNDLTDRVARAMLMPRRSIEKALRLGDSVPQIKLDWGNVPPDQVELRVREVWRAMRRS